MRPSSSCSTATLILSWCLLLVARLTSSGARAAGWGGWGEARRTGQRGRVPSNDDGPSDADFDKVIRQLELDQVRKISRNCWFDSPEPLSVTLPPCSKATTSCHFQCPLLITGRASYCVSLVDKVLSGHGSSTIVDVAGEVYFLFQHRAPVRRRFVMKSVSTSTRVRRQCLNYCCPCLMWLSSTPEA